MAIDFFGRPPNTNIPKPKSSKYFLAVMGLNVLIFLVYLPKPKTAQILENRCLPLTKNRGIIIV